MISYLVFVTQCLNHLQKQQKCQTDKIDFNHKRDKTRRLNSNEKPDGELYKANNNNNPGILYF